MDPNNLDSFCSHEHWGSMASFNMSPEGFRADVVPGALPTRSTTLFDLLLDPYFMLLTGIDLNTITKTTFGEEDPCLAAANDPRHAFDVLWPCIAKHRSTGIYQATRRGILKTYGVDIDLLDIDQLDDLNTEIDKHYHAPFDWYLEAMAKTKLRRLIRPVHPEFYINIDESPSVKKELSFTNTVMRIDPLTELWPTDCPRRDRLAGAVDIDPVNAESWRTFIDRLFDYASKRSAIGIKQALAYHRPLRFRRPSDREVCFRGDLTADQQRMFSDWIVHTCCQCAHDRSWPHQIHVGTHNLPHSNPESLAILAESYPKQQVVLLHGWPYITETGELARQFDNVFIDACWQVILDPDYLRQSLRTWLPQLPSSKLMLSHDATSVEMAVGSSEVTRDILTEVLTEISMTNDQRQHTAAALLGVNAASLYDAASLDD